MKLTNIKCGCEITNWLSAQRLDSILSHDRVEHIVNQHFGAPDGTTSLFDLPLGYTPEEYVKVLMEQIVLGSKHLWTAEKIKVTWTNEEAWIGYRHDYGNMGTYGADVETNCVRVVLVLDQFGTLRICTAYPCSPHLAPQLVTEPRERGDLEENHNND